LKIFFFNFKIECLVLTNYTKFQILRIKIVILVNFKWNILLNSLNDSLNRF
jgi:hypothetical protein